MSAPKANEAAVAAVQQALGCEVGGAPFGSGLDYRAEVCAVHHRAMLVFGGTVSGRIAAWTERGCPVAVAAADAAAPHIAAQALRDAAREPMDDGYYVGDVYRRHLERRADRLEAGQ